MDRRLVDLLDEMALRLEPMLVDWLESHLATLWVEKMVDGLVWK